MPFTPAKALRPNAMTPANALKPTTRTPLKALEPNATTPEKTLKLGNSNSSSIDDESQEGITVAIRMRPLNNAEGKQGRIWKVLPQYSSVTQTTREGKPLGEKITNRTFFTFDKTFGEDTSNRHVYDGVAKGIVCSAVDGLNGTIFAYGQTSSGKTFTMQGSGNLEQGSGGEGGVVHMAAQDIFSQIAQQPNRIFLVRVSFLEIYNEEVRDLLADSIQSLQIREDPRRGVFVQSVEEIVTDFESLLRILFRGDKSRTFAATGMNERSSRSHTILRITIESREKEIQDEFAGDSENQGPSGDGAVRISTLNLVDLAGSESVRHTGATGERQKEGGLINQSLLTLSRVIVALGTPNQAHINFRDSKLTRILQPSLSGNARMAVICCATPSELYLEETRSTLQFAQRAKLVKTNAQVNEVLDERSMIRRLQKELAEAKRQYSGPGHHQVRELEAQVATAGTQALEAKAKLDRLKASILNAGYLFDQHIDSEIKGLTLRTSTSLKTRRKSDGLLQLNQCTPSKSTPSMRHAPQTIPREMKAGVLERPHLATDQELALVQQALTARNQVIRDLNATVISYSEQIKKKNDDVAIAMDQNAALSHERSHAYEKIDELKGVVASLEATIEISAKETEHAILEKNETAVDLLEKLQLSLARNSDLEVQLEDMQKTLDDIRNERVTIALELSQSVTENQRLLEERDADRASLHNLAGKNELLLSNLSEASTERDAAVLESQRLQTELASVENTFNILKAEAGEQLARSVELEGRFSESASTVEKLVSEIAVAQEENVALTGRITCLECEKSSLLDHVSSLQNGFLEERETLNAFISDAESRAEILQKEKEASDSHVEEINLANQMLQDTASRLETELGLLCESKNELIQKNDEDVQALKNLLAEANVKLLQESNRSELFEGKISALESTLNLSEASCQDLQIALGSLQIEKSTNQSRFEDTNKDLLNKDREIQALREELDLVTAEKNSQEAVLNSCQVSLEHLEGQVIAAEEQMNRLAADKDALVAEKEESLEAMKSKVRCSLEDAEALKSTNTSLLENISQLTETIEEHEVFRLNSIESENALRSEIQCLTEAIGLADHDKCERDQLLVAADIEARALHEELEGLEKQLEECLASAKVDQRELESHQTTLAEAKIKCQAFETELTLLAENRKGVDIKIEELEVEISALKEANDDKNSTIEHYIAENKSSTEESRRQLEEMMSSVHEKNQEVERLKLALAENQRHSEQLVLEIASLREAGSESEVTIVRYVTEIEEITRNFNRRLEEKNMECEIKAREVEGLRSQIDRLDSEREEIESAQIEMKETISFLTAEKEDGRGMVESFGIQKMEIEQELKSIKTINETLLATIEDSKALLAESESMVAKLEAENCETVTRYEDELKDLQDQIESVFQEATSLQREKAELECLCSEFRDEISSIRSKARLVEDELEKMSQSRHAIAESLRERESERDEATAEVERLYEKNRELTDSLVAFIPKETETKLRTELSELQAENVELKHLLASVNESEERFRNAVAVAESNSRGKAAELEQALYSLAQLEEELSQSENAAVERGQNQDSRTVSVGQIEKLLAEKEAIETMLMEEKEARARFEEKLKKQMGDEQRVLIQEGESMMSQLRSKIDDYEIRIEQCQSEAYTARQQVEEINDERKNIEVKYLETQEQVDNYALEVTQHQTQIAVLQSELKIAKSECYSLKESLIDMKEKMRRSARDSEKAARECEMASSEVSTLRRKLTSVESQVQTHKSENLRLRKRLQDAQENDDLINELKKEVQNKGNEIDRIGQQLVELEQDRKNALAELATIQLGIVSEQTVDSKELKKLEDEIDKLKGKIDAKNQQMEIKEQRIKKLEATRLTKGQLETIKNNKLDNIRLQKECSKLTSEVASLQSHIKSVGPKTDLLTEINELRFDKEALESKLRKFATHCQRLEDDKAGMADALRTCNIDIEAYGNDISEAVIHLCDKLTSAEEVRSKSKLAGVDKELENDNRNLRQKLEQVSQSEKRLMERLKNSSREAEELKKSIEMHKGEASGASTDVGHKLRYLEQENLQLMVDIKATKKQLQAARGELESLRMGAIDENPTTDFGNAYIRSGSTPARGIASTKECETETSDTIELTEMAKTFAGTKTLSAKDSRAYQNRKILSDNTNQPAGIESSAIRTDKRRRLVDSPMSTSKNERKRGKTAVIPGLGESSSLDSDNTGECKQS